MKRKQLIIIFLLSLFFQAGAQMTKEYEKSLEILNADYGVCYQIGNYMLCPEKKIIRVGQMFGTATIDAFGYFPDPSLKYDEVTMIIFAGMVFLDKSNFNIDWRTVQLLSYSENHSEFTDGKDLYTLRYGAEVRKKGVYDKNSYKPNPDSKVVQKRLFPEEYGYGDEMTKDMLEKILANAPKGRIALGRSKYISFYVLNNKFYYDENPIYEKFDVPNLRTITSKEGFVTEYITDGKKTILGGEKGGYSFKEISGKKYVLTEDWMVEGIDFPSLRVLGENMLMDKNALYYETNRIPFDKLNGFKFIIREIN